MQVRRLNQNFYIHNPNLQQVLHNKNRGYGIVLINIHGLYFGIPLHSNIRGPGFITSKIFDPKTGKEEKRGLDYQKAIILDTKRDLIGSFKFPEYGLVQSSEKQIIYEFSDYITSYIVDALNMDKNAFKRKYKFSTLQNYHKELSINVVNRFMGLNLLSTNFYCNN